MFVSRVRRTAGEDEAAIAIAAIDIAAFVDLQKDARMAKSFAARNIGSAVTGDAGGRDTDGFGVGVHAPPISKPEMRVQQSAWPQMGLAGEFMPPKCARSFAPCGVSVYAVAP